MQKYIIVPTNKNESNNRVFINVDRIIAFEELKDNDGNKGTRIMLENDLVVLTKKTPDEVLKMVKKEDERERTNNNK